MVNKNEYVQNLSLDIIDVPRLAARTKSDDSHFDELVSSIRAFGVLQPILVKPVGERFEIIAGHRRFLASLALGLVTIPCVVCSVDDVNSEVMKLHENFCREDVNIVDEAIFLEGVMAKLGLSVAELAQKIGRSESYIRDRLEMQNWDKEVLNAVWEGDISATAAGWINKIDNINVRRDWLSIAVRAGVTGSQAQHWYQQYSYGHLPETPTEKIVDDLKTGVSVYVKQVKCGLCGSEMLLSDAILVYSHKECSDYWKVQQKVNAEAENAKEAKK